MRQRRYKSPECICTDVPAVRAMIIVEGKPPHERRLVRHMDCPFHGVEIYHDGRLVKARGLNYEETRDAEARREESRRRNSGRPHPVRLLAGPPMGTEPGPEGA